jgi:hypothetical protein
MGVGAALGTHARVGERDGVPAPARTLWEDALAVFREYGDRLSAAVTLRTLGLLARTEEDGARARALLAESFALLRESAHAPQVAQGLYLCGVRAMSAGQTARGVPAVSAGDTARGVRLLGAAVALHPPLAAGPELERRPSIRPQAGRASGDR